MDAITHARPNVYGWLTNSREELRYRMTILVVDIDMIIYPCPEPDGGLHNLC